MLEFHGRDFLILFINFVVLFFALNSLLFKPLAKIFKEREAATKGALDEAKSLTSKKDNSIAAMNAELLEARTKAKASQSALREEGIDAQKAMLSKAEAEAVATIEKARKELQAEAERARASLRSDIDKFSEEIVRKLVKV